MRHNLIEIPKLLRTPLFFCGTFSCVLRSTHRIKIQCTDEQQTMVNGRPSTKPTLTKIFNNKIMNFSRRWCLNHRCWRDLKFNSPNHNNFYLFSEFDRFGRAFILLFFFHHFFFPIVWYVCTHRSVEWWRRNSAASLLNVITIFSLMLLATMTNRVHTHLYLR